MKNEVHIKDITIGNDMPKICVPITGKDYEEICQQADNISKLNISIVEWRMDYYTLVHSEENVMNVLIYLEKVLQNKLILATFRTKDEGGEAFIELNEYVKLNEFVAKSGLVDLIDVELFLGDTLVEKLISSIHREHVRVIMSNHDFHKTPEKEEIIRRLVKMQNLNADIAKIAVMPVCERDVLTLLDATLTMKEEHPACPIVTMSMASMGKLSRISGELFGSAITFAAAGESSAPGQMPVGEMKQILNVLHNS